MEELPGGATVLIDHVDGEYRYRLAKIDGGYLITARTRDALGLTFIAEWLHETEEIRTGGSGGDHGVEHRHLCNERRKRQF